MKLNAKSLIAARFVYPMVDRPALNRLMVEPDGTTVGIDGHAMCIVTPPVEDTPTSGPAVPVYVAHAAAKEMAADLKSLKDADYTWKHGEFIREHEHGTRTITPAKDDPGPFPGWKDVVPDDRDNDNAATVDMALLGRAIVALKEFTNGDNRGATIRISNDELGPIKITAKSAETGQAMTVVVMPLRL
jgi:hypothetical protein